VTDDALALAFRTGLPFVGLRDHEHDPDLDTLIPPDAARAARAVPLAADDEHLRLAVTDPDADLVALSPYLGHLRVELALAAEEEIEAILGPPPPEPVTTGPALREPLATEHPPLEAVAAEPEATEHRALEPSAAEPEAAEHEPPEPLAAEREAAEREPPELLGAESEAAEHEPSEPQLAAPAPPDAIAADPQAAAPAPSEPLAADPQAAERAPSEPLAADPQAAEQAPPEPLAADPQAAEQAPPEPLAADPQAAAPAPPQPLAADPQPAASVAADPELDGEVPSWLEAPRRRGKVALAAFIVAMVLIVAAGAVAAYVLTR
jgi:Type II secretion system (T2SS), protein E, N-terminal domain